MLWQLLRGCSSGYSPLRGYDADEDPDVEMGLLDVVDPKITGKANVNSLMAIFEESNITFGIRAILLITCLTTFLAEVAPPTEVRRLETDAVFCSDPTNHFKQLLSFMLIQMIAEGEVLFVATYFAIAKTSGGARSIFNGKAFSRKCKPPPSTNLPDITQVLLLFDEMCRGGLSFPCVMVGDIRHYFHQLPLHFEISRYFCLYALKQFYRWCCVPMGFSWSPFIAQSISMGLVIKAIGQAGYDISAYCHLPSPPSHVAIRDKTGNIRVLAFVWYDNIFMACGDPQTAPRLSSIFKSLCEDDNNGRIKLKEWHFFGHRSFARPPDPDLTNDDVEERTQPFYLGLEFCRWRKGESEKPTTTGGLKKNVFGSG